MASGINTGSGREAEGVSASVVKEATGLVAGPAGNAEGIVPELDESSAFASQAAVGWQCVHYRKSPF